MVTNQKRLTQKYMFQIIIFIFMNRRVIPFAKSFCNHLDLGYIMLEHEKNRW